MIIYEGVEEYGKYNYYWNYCSYDIDWNSF